VRRALDVAGYEHGLASRRFDLAPRVLFMFIEIGDEDVGAFTRVSNRNSATDTASPPMMTALLLRRLPAPL
jgi:hypothetical protein